MSIWEKNQKMPQFEQLRGEHQTEVLIIGGGITGILCAYFLEQENVPYILVEGDRICGGTTHNTTAKITTVHGIIYSNIAKQYGIENAQKYWKAQQKALEEYRSLSESIECDFEKQSSYLYTVSGNNALEEEMKILEDLRTEARWSDKAALPFQVDKTIAIPHQAQFQPLKFVAELAKDMNIYEKTFVKQIEETTAYTEQAEIKAKHIIVATHFPFINRHGSYFIKLYQDRSYVIALENAVGVEGMYRDADKKGLSFRNYGEYLLLGGGSHRTGKKGGKFQELREFAKRYYPNATEAYRWAAQDCMSLDGIPYIGNYSKHTPNLYVAAGFGKWGMTNAMAAGMILTDLILGKENEFASVFSPSRNMIKPQLFINLGETAKNILTPTVPRCSHLGCALKWNPAEHSWDCACHGSRFTGEGEVIENPAKKNIDIAHK